ncbi:hypothetical protein B0H13DRAFT_2664277 [Mycena leptocephala]|nr:hypothetical protein B0H13DRAFT_2664277 [Mycena leptocephala]
MHLLYSSVFLLALATLGSTVGTPRLLRPRNLNTADMQVDANGRLLTNAKRLAIGLPPLPPRRRATTAARAVLPRSSAVPVTQTCNLMLTDSNGESQGYVSGTDNGYGEFYILSAQTNALAVSFTYTPGSTPATQLNLLIANNPNPTYPFFGGRGTPGGGVPGETLGSSNIFNYIEPVATTESPAGSAPFPGHYLHENFDSGRSGNIESAIWNYDPDTQLLTATWVNPAPDSSAIPLTLLTQIGTFMLVPNDNVATFIRYESGGSEPIDIVNLKCVPLPE